MPDGAIVIPDTSAAPKDYTLAGAQEVALKSVRALIDGSGAGSSFVPTLQLLDPNGHVMWEGPAFSTVAAGASADVSWFPGVVATDTGIKFDQPNTDPLGAAGSLRIDTGLIEVGNVIPADWEVTSVDVQWSTSSTTGFDIETDGGPFKVNANTVGPNAGHIDLFGQDHVSITSVGGSLFEVLPSGAYVLANLPNADPGITGHLWKDAGNNLKVSP